MMVAEHIHKWQHLTGTDFICNAKECKTVTSLKDLLANTAKDSALREKIKIYADLLMSRELKKDASQRVYAWVMANTNKDNLPIVLRNQQEKLL